MTYLISLTLFAALPGALGFLECPGDSASFISNVTNAFEEAQIVPDVLTSFDPSAILNVTFPVSGILPGELVPLSETSNEPQFSLCGNDAALANQTFVLAMVDPDARTNVSVAQGRHFLGGGFVFRNDHSNKLVNTTPALSDYVGPEPLAGQSPHRYVIVAYIQPPNFEKIAPSFVNESTSRLYFNLSNFEEEVHLGNPIAGNFFYAANTTVTTTASSMTSSSSTSTSATPSSISTTNSAQTAKFNWFPTIALLLVLRARTVPYYFNL
ncbi:phosphatidylethanolamine-binding protein [Amanita rubescens]|nr:phosphatidylethanolamine-binding protein [Amanita rubescens]